MYRYSRLATASTLHTRPVVFTKSACRLSRPLFAMSTIHRRDQSTLTHTHGTATKGPSFTLPISNKHEAHTLAAVDTPSSPHSSSSPSSPSPSPTATLPPRPLASLPLTTLLRSILLHTVTASPFLLRLTTRFLSGNIDRLHLDSPFNPLGWLLYHVFYKHFCAGRTEAEIQSVVAGLRQRGIAGVILAYAREVELGGDTAPSAAEEAAQVRQWLEGTKRTLEYTPPGDFVAVKYSGAGRGALKLLGAQPPGKPTPELESALGEICELAVEKGVRLLMDAEQVGVQQGMDMWTVELMRRYNNRRSDGKAVVYNTYQMYLKSTPSNLQHHLSLSRTEKWPIGIKLVRGAYLSSDPRSAICDTEADTHTQYNSAVGMLLAGQHGAKVDLVLATHNKESTRRARAAAKDARVDGNGAGVREITYAQLMGMADELSFGLAQEGGKEGGEGVGEVKVVKYLVWGSVGDCVKYLLRRAQENKAAVGRSRENVEACWDEVKWRVGLRR